MTVETEVTRVILQGNAVLTTWSYTFPIPGSTATDQTNAELIFTDTASVSTTLANNLWSITGVDTGVGGTVTYNPGSPITTGSTVTLVRIVPYEQTTSLSAQGAYSPAVVEDALDNIVFGTEQLNTWRLQTIRAPITDAALNDLPPAADRASSYLFFDSSGQPTTASVTGGIPTSILVGTDSTHSTLTTALHMTGSGVTSVVTVAGVTTATLGVPALTSAHIFVGNGSNIATDVAMSGDVTISNAGVTAVTANIPRTNASTQWTKRVAGATAVTLTDAATVAWDMSLGNEFILTATSGIGNSRTMGAPSNVLDGDAGFFYFIQDSTGSRTMTMGSGNNYLWAGGSQATGSSAGNSIDKYAYAVKGTKLLMDLIGKAYA